MTKVVNVNTDEYDVYIGRPSKWGNPFKIGRDGTRQGVISKYMKWLLMNDTLMCDIMTLEGKVLGCHCKPKPCHGDVIVDVIEAKGNLTKLKHFFE
jgi:hypothetical protein